MDSDAGRIFYATDDEIDKLKEEIPNIQKFEYGQRVQIGECWFEVCDVKIRQQRLVLKPIPSPADPEAEAKLMRQIPPIGILPEQ